MGIKDKLKNSPKFIRTPIEMMYGKLPYKLKHSREYIKNYNETYTLLNKSQWWSKQELEEYQMKQIKELIKHAYETVPYYTKLFDEHDIKVSQIQDFNDMKKIPYLTKEIIQNNLENLVSTKYKKSQLRYITTGGSTGIPMGFYQYENYEEARESAFIRFLYDKVEYSDGDKTLVLRGNIVKSIDEENNIFFEMNYARNELVASSYHLTQKNMKYYIEAIKKFKPICIKAYPSSLYLLAKYMKENEINDFYFIKSIILASENIYNYQNELFEEVFANAKIFSFYGHTENACLAGSCEKNDYYHLQSEYGYTELINDDGQAVTKEDEIGEIVTTGFNNYAVPFIRYKTADLAVNTNEKCNCDRNYKLIKRIEGRKQEYIFIKKGKKITLTALIFAQHFHAFTKIANMQIVQSEIGKILINIVKTDGYTEEDEKEISQKIYRVAKDDLEITFNYINNIPRTKRGKQKFLIQNIKKIKS